MRRLTTTGAVLLTCACESPLAPSPEVVLHPNTLRNNLGTTLNWISDGDGLRLSDGARTPADSLVRMIGYRIIRIPGGYLARWFHWRAAVGALRPMQRDFVGRLQEVRTGLPEFKRYAAERGLRVIYTLNVSEGPGPALELLRVWDSLPPAGAAPIEIVELGNEEYDRGLTPDSGLAYVARALPIARAIREARPRVRIAGLLSNPVVSVWDSATAALRPYVDLYVWHRYVPGTPYGATAFTDAREAFARAEAEVAAWQRMRHLNSAEIWLGEYNLSWRLRGEFQNVSPEPRTSLLLGNFLTLAVRQRWAGLVKCCVANPRWHLYADVAFADSSTPQLTNGGRVQRMLHAWIARQDAVGEWPVPATPWWRRSILVGRGPGGLTLLVQNHMGEAFAVPAVLAGSGADSARGLGAVTGRLVPLRRSGEDALVVGAHEIMVVYLRSAPR